MFNSWVNASIKIISLEVNILCSLLHRKMLGEIKNSNRNMVPDSDNMVSKQGGEF